MSDKKVYMLENIKGSISVEKDKVTIVMSDVEGEYELFLDDKKECGLSADYRGRVMKKINCDADNIGSVFIKKDGKTVAKTVFKEEKTEVKEVFREVKEEVEKIEEKPIKVFEEKKEEMPKTDYSFTSDFSTIIDRFKEQMARLEETRVIDEEDIAYIEKKDRGFAPFSDEEKWERIYPDYLWRLPIRDIKFPSNLFVISGQKRYKHIILREMSDRFKVGVPDVYDDKNAQMAYTNGFYSFMSRDGGETENGTAGYWMADILKN